MVTKRVLGWKRDPDYALRAKHVPHLLRGAAPAALPPLTDLEAGSPPCYDQGDLGSCTSHAICGAFEIKEQLEGTDTGTPARLFVYQMELLTQGTWGQDEGSTITTGMQVALSYGFPPEAEYPYVDTVAALKVKPSPAVYALGRARRATAAMEAAIQNDHDNIVAMLAGNSAVAGGFDVPQSFMSQEVADTGIWNPPGGNDPIVGGHAVCIVGSDDVRGTYKIRNSWGTDWGLNGYVHIPQAWVQANFSDLMAVVDAPAAPASAVA